jgi:hypothetical protein
MRSRGVAPTWYDAASVEVVTWIWESLHGPVPDDVLGEGLGVAEPDDVGFALLLEVGSGEVLWSGVGLAVGVPPPPKKTARTPSTSASTTMTTRRRRTQ